MIIKVLLFIIVLIFVYESFQIMYKMREEYFTSKHNNHTEQFVSLSGNPEQDDIAKTIVSYAKNDLNVIIDINALADQLRFSSLEDLNPTKIIEKLILNSPALMDSLKDSNIKDNLKLCIAKELSGLIFSDKGLRLELMRSLQSIGKDEFSVFFSFDMLEKFLNETASENLNKGNF